MQKSDGEYSGTSVDSLLANYSLGTLFTLCQVKHFACALYRLPDSYTSQPSHQQSYNRRHLIIDLGGSRDLDHLQIEEMGKGFIFHPFSSERHQVKFINKDIHIVEHAGELDLVHSIIRSEEFEAIFDPELLNQDTDDEQDKEICISGQNHDQNSSFIELINKAIKEINMDHFQKVVLSRTKTIDLPDGFDPFTFYNKLSDQYRNAFVYLCYIPKIGSWLGATPETLINLDQQRQFETVALAATQAHNKDNCIEDTTWSQKDIEEQAMVSRYIINCFKQIRLREFEEIGPRTHLSGNLVHLKTIYKVDMDKVAFPQLGSVMLELLHPTSAVCGMPKDETQRFIDENEGFDREYFSGFLGPVNIDEETNIFVNLRCMKLMDIKAKLFAGAGIISNSNSNKEWKETELKMDTLLKVLRELF